MSKRYYAVQWCHDRRGWLDLPLYGFQRVPLEREAREFTQEHHVVTRVIRKPKGWEPPKAPEGCVLNAWGEVLRTDFPLIDIKVELIHIPPRQPEPDPLEAPSTRGTDPDRLWRQAQEGDSKSAEALAKHCARAGDTDKMVELGVLAFYSGWEHIIPHLKPAHEALKSFAKDAQNEEFLRLLGW